MMPIVKGERFCAKRDKTYNFVMMVPPVVSDIGGKEVYECKDTIYSKACFDPEVYP